jgi:hypothetical protein
MTCLWHRRLDIAQGRGTVTHAARSGQCFIQVEAAVGDRMRAMRRPGESCSEVILKLVELKTSDPKKAVRVGRLRSLAGSKGRPA